MILVIHILAAIMSLISTGIAFFYPSQTKLNITYGLVAMMLLTGFSLILTKPAHLTQTCLEGLAYLAIVSYGIVAAKNKLNSIRS